MVHATHARHICCRQLMRQYCAIPISQHFQAILPFVDRWLAKKEEPHICLVLVTLRLEWESMMGELLGARCLTCRRAENLPRPPVWLQRDIRLAGGRLGSSNLVRPAPLNGATPRRRPRLPTRPRQSASTNMCTSCSTEDQGSKQLRDFMERPSLNC